MATPQITQAAARSLNLPDGFKTYSPFPFSGMNLQSAGTAIDDKEFTYLENFFRLGDGYLRTGWDVGPALYDATGDFGKSILCFYFYNIGDNFYAAVFHTDGTAIQIDMAGHGTAISFTPGTFYDPAHPQNIPHVSQWGIQYLLICNRNTDNDYWIWDGSVLYFAGSAAPNGVTILSGGSGYNSAPQVTVVDSHGGGFSAQANIQGGSVVSVDIINPGSGFLPSDTPQILFQGGGSDRSAHLVAHLAVSGVASVDVAAGGSGYTSAPTLTFTPGPGGAGAGSGAAATAVTDGNTITAVIMTNNGSGYEAAPTITVGGPGSGAVLNANLDSRGVGSISVNDGGTGYQYPPILTIVGGGGSGAQAVANLAPTSIQKINVTAGGNGFTSEPTLTITGGGGTGATARAFINNGQVSAVQLKSAGHGYTSQPFVNVQGGGGGTGVGLLVMLVPTHIASVSVSNSGNDYTDEPTVEIGAGANLAATATLNMMPFGVSGGCIETFQQRVWIANPAPPTIGVKPQPPGGNFAVSAPQSLTDFATSDGGLLFTSDDDFLQTKYTDIRQSNGYLYFFGDGSIAVVSNVQTTGTPPVTSFNYQNVDLETGLSWRDTRQDFGRSMVFANEAGIFGLYGGSASKVSDKLNKLYDVALFPPAGGALTPSGAKAHIHKVKHYFMLMTILDPDTGAPRNVMATWNEKEWTISSQTVALIYIGSQKIGSQFTAWGTDGRYLLPMFKTPSTNLVKRLDTKHYGTDAMFIMKDLHRLYVQAQDHSQGAQGISINCVVAASGIASQIPDYKSLASGTYDAGEILYGQPIWPAGDVSMGAAAPPFYPLWGAGSPGVPFMTLGWRMSTTSPDFSISHLLIGYVYTAAYG